MCLSPGLTSLGEKVLDLSNGGLGLHLGEAQAGDKSVVAEFGGPGAQGLSWGGGMDWGPRQLLWEGEGWRPGPPTHPADTTTMGRKAILTRQPGRLWTSWGMV